MKKKVMLNNWFILLIIYSLLLTGWLIQMEIDKADRETLGQRIRRLRQERNLSQTKLSKRIDVTISWISTIEADKAKPSPELLTKMAAVFKIPIRELLENEDLHMEFAARIKLVEVLLETNQADEAESLLIELSTSPLLPPEKEAKLALLLADCKFKTKNYLGALEILKPLSHRLEAENYHDAYLLASIHNLLGSVFFYMQNVYDAYSAWKRAHDLISRFVNFDILAAKISYNVALSLLRMDKPQEAIMYLNQAERYYSQSNSLHLLADALFTRGIAYKNIKDFGRAMECFEQAKAIIQAIEHESLALIIRHTIATEITAHDHPQLALDELNECLHRYLQMKDFPRVVLVLTKMASINISILNLGRALEHLQDAEYNVEKHSLWELAESAEFLKWKAKYHFQTQEYNKSIEFAFKSAKAFGTLGLKKDRAKAFHVAIDSYKELGEFENALALALECNPFFD